MSVEPRTLRPGDRLGKQSKRERRWENSRRLRGFRSPPVDRKYRFADAQCRCARANSPGLRTARRVSGIQNGAQLCGKLLDREGLGNEVNPGIEDTVVDDRVPREPGRVQHSWRAGRSVSAAAASARPFISGITISVNSSATSGCSARSRSAALPPSAATTGSRFPASASVDSAPDPLSSSTSRMTLAGR